MSYSMFTPSGACGKQSAQLPLLRGDTGYVNVSASSSTPAAEVLFLQPPQLTGSDLALAKASMTAVTPGLNSGGKTKQRKRRPRLVREGQCISKFFSIDGPRPYPQNGIGLDQQIQIELTGTSGIVLTSSLTPGVTTYFSRAFQFSDFAASTTLATVFDQYRYDQLEVWFEPINPSLSTGGFPTLSTTVDVDDANTPSTIGAVYDHQGAETGGGNSGRYHKWRPHNAVALYSGVFTSFGNEPSGWIDAASPSVQHYGFKACATSNSGTAFQYLLSYRAVMSLRAPAIN